VVRCKKFSKKEKKKLWRGGAVANHRAGGTPTSFSSFFSDGLLFREKGELLSKFNLEREVEEFCFVFLWFFPFIVPSLILI